MERSPDCLAIHQQRKAICSSRSVDTAMEMKRHEQSHQDVVYRGQIVRVQVPQYYYAVCDDDFRYLFERLAAGNNPGTPCKKFQPLPSHPVCAAAAIGIRSAPRPVCRRRHHPPLPLTVLVDGSNLDHVRQRSPQSSLSSADHRDGPIQRPRWSPVRRSGSVELSRCRSEPDLLGERDAALGSKVITVSDAETNYWSWTQPDEERRLDVPSYPYSPSLSAVQAGSSRTVVLRKNGGTFGFVLCGAKSRYEDASGTTFTPTAMLPALQYLDFVEAGSIAEKAGLVAGDYLLEINGQNVTGASHHHTVQLIKQAGDAVYLKVVTPTLTSDTPTTTEHAIPTRISAARRPSDGQPLKDRLAIDMDANPDLRLSVSERGFQNKPSHSNTRDSISSLRQALRPSPATSSDMTRDADDKSGTNPLTRRRFEELIADGCGQPAIVPKTSPQRSLPDIVILSPPPPPPPPPPPKNSRPSIGAVDDKLNARVQPASAVLSNFGMNKSDTATAAANAKHHSMQRHQPAVAGDRSVGTSATTLMKSNGDAKSGQLIRNGSASTTTLEHRINDEQAKQKPRRRLAPDPPKPPPLPPLPAPPPQARRVSLPSSVERLSATPLAAQLSSSNGKLDTSHSFDVTLTSSSVHSSSVTRNGLHQTTVVEPGLVPTTSTAGGNVGAFSAEAATRAISMSSSRNNGHRIEEAKSDKKWTETTRNESHPETGKITSGAGVEEVQHKRRKAPSPPKIPSQHSSKGASGEAMSLPGSKRCGPTSSDFDDCGEAGLLRQTTSSSSFLTTKPSCPVTSDIPPARLVQESGSADQVRTAVDAVDGRGVDRVGRDAAKSSSSSDAGSEFPNFIRMAEQARQDYVRRKATAAMIARAAANEMKQVAATDEPTGQSAEVDSATSTVPPAPTKSVSPKPEVVRGPEMAGVSSEAKKPNTKIMRGKAVERCKRPSSSASSITVTSSSPTMIRLSPPPGFDDYV